MVLATSHRGRLELDEVVLELEEKKDGLVGVGTWVVMVGERENAGAVGDGIVRRPDIFVYREGGCADLDGADRGHMVVTAWPCGTVRGGWSWENNVERELVMGLDGRISLLDDKDDEGKEVRRDGV